MDFLKRKIGLSAYYDALVRVYRPLGRLAVHTVLGRQHIDPKFSEWLLLAVTEVNGYELGMHLVGLVLLPVSLVHALAGWIGGRENTRFSVTDLERSVAHHR